MIIYTQGHFIDTVAGATVGLTLAGANPTDGFSPNAANLTAAIGNGTSGNYGAYDALVIGETSGAFGAAEKTILSNFVTAGGNAVVLGAHGSEVNFLNSTFGFSVSGFSPGPSSADNGLINRVAGSGPANLLGLNGSWYLDATTLPTAATLLYERNDNGAASAFVMSYGSGTLSWLAWDFYTGSNLDSDQTDWSSVLGEGAIGTGVPGISVPEPSVVALSGLGLAVMGFRRRKLVR